MADLIRIPSLGAAVANVIILEWRCEEGDDLEEGETLVEVETDKMNMEIPVEQGGVLRRILAPEGAEREEGDPLAIIGDADEDVSDLVEQAADEVE